jgi:formylmethanofuran--tetrahydromethanopterin N-formyltransferase
LAESGASGFESVFEGLSEAAIAKATAAGIRAVGAEGNGEILRISAGNYGGKLGAFHFHLHRLLA